MTSPRPPDDAQGYLESLMRAEQDAMKQFDDTLVSVAGVGTKDHGTSSGQFFPFSLFADLQREYFRQLWRFWNSVFLQNCAGGAHSDVALARGDKRFSRTKPGRRCHITTCSSSHIYWVQDSYTNSWIRRRLTTRQNCSSGFMLGSSSMR